MSVYRLEYLFTCSSCASFSSVAGVAPSMERGGWVDGSFRWRPQGLPRLSNMSKAECPTCRQIYGDDKHKKNGSIRKTFTHIDLPIWYKKKESKTERLPEYYKLVWIKCNRFRMGINYLSKTETEEL